MQTQFNKCVCVCITFAYNASVTVNPNDSIQSYDFHLNKMHLSISMLHTGLLGLLQNAFIECVLIREIANNQHDHCKCSYFW